jgi:NAD+ synthase/NAD+ synthase (glutamine-hydrolysing)
VVVEHESVARILEAGHSEEVVRKVHGLLIRAEYKRRQAAPSLKVSPTAFGEGWRFPVAHSWDPARSRSGKTP